MLMELDLKKDLEEESMKVWEDRGEWIDSAGALDVG